MLKGLHPLLSPPLLTVLAEMGHGDELAIVATGETRLYGNVLLRNGAVRP